MANVIQQYNPVEIRFVGQAIVVGAVEVGRVVAELPEFGLALPRMVSPAQKSELLWEARMMDGALLKARTPAKMQEMVEEWWASFWRRHLSVSVSIYDLACFTPNHEVEAMKKGFADEKMKADLAMGLLEKERNEFMLDIDRTSMALNAARETNEQLLKRIHDLERLVEELGEKRIDTLMAGASEDALGFSAEDVVIAEVATDALDPTPGSPTFLGVKLPPAPEFIEPLKPLTLVEGEAQCGDWFGAIKDDTLRSLACRAYRRGGGVDACSTTLREAFLLGFTWGGTPEGLDFWIGIRDAMFYLEPQGALALVEFAPPQEAA